MEIQHKFRHGDLPVQRQIQQIRVGHTFPDKGQGAVRGGHPEKLRRVFPVPAQQAFQVPVINSVQPCRHPVQPDILRSPDIVRRACNILHAAFITGFLIPAALNPPVDPPVQQEADQRGQAQEKNQQRIERDQDSPEGQETQQVGKNLHHGVINPGIMGKVAVAAGKALVLQRPEMFIFLVAVIRCQSLAGNPPEKEGIHAEFMPVNQPVQELLQPG